MLTIKSAPFLCVTIFLLGPATVLAQLQDATMDDYNQWKLALTAGGAASSVTVSSLPGYKVELVRTAAADEGSWISLTFDPQGRIVIGREAKGLLRLTLGDGEHPVAKVEKINDTLLEPRGLLFAHDALYVSANNSKGLYRLRDTQGDGTFQEIKLLRELPGGVGHGRNGLALGPDGLIYMALGNNVQVLDGVAGISPYRHYGEDRLLPCAWNEFLFDSDVKPPCGQIARCDRDGKSWQLFAGGFRNPYDLAFSPSGELFTYDADMEWDQGAPWYRPTCVMHVVSGGEYGWRQGTSVWPDFYPDSLPRVCDIGLGSPTGVAFGTKSKFPGKYRDALYVLDWAYGRIIAVHLTSAGASFTGEAETFLKGKPLNVTDLDFGPDGAMYFTVGGRKTQGALYRVRYVGKSPLEDAVPPAAPTDIVMLRRQMEQFQMRDAKPTEIADILANVGHEDRFVDFAACAALTNQPLPAWSNLAGDALRPQAAASHLLALARVCPKEMSSAVVTGSCEIMAKPPNAATRLRALRALQLVFIRHGRPAEKQAKELLQVLGQMHAAAESYAEKYLLSELLVYLRDERAPGRILAHLTAAKTAEENLFYCYILRNVPQGWTLDQRRQFFAALREAEGFPGSQYLPRYLTFLRTDAIALLSEQERTALAPELARLGGASDAATAPAESPRPLVKEWKLEELTPALEQVGKGRDLQRGRKLFSAALCARCHRFGKLGIPIGPDLNSVASRFGRKDLLDHILNPSKVIDEKYQSIVLQTSDGRSLTGQFAGVDRDFLYIASNPLEPARAERVERDKITGRKSSTVSPMPTGLLNTLNQDEIFDLLAFLEAR